MEFIIIVKMNLPLLIFLDKMKIFSKAIELIKSSDQFHSSELLRYKGDSQYKTLTGGIISLITIIAIIIAFMSMIKSTF